MDFNDFNEQSFLQNSSNTVTNMVTLNLLETITKIIIGCNTIVKIDSVLPKKNEFVIVQKYHL